MDKKTVQARIQAIKAKFTEFDNLVTELYNELEGDEDMDLVYQTIKNEVNTKDLEEGLIILESRAGYLEDYV
jgi:hypothetical protein